jgi:GNAT superfamily N-acetyltransferase
LQPDDRALSRFPRCGALRGRGEVLTACTIRYAKADEALLANAILREAAQWLADSGRKLWDESEFDAGDIAERAVRGELVLGFDDGRAVACSYLQVDDDAFWPVARVHEALYVHRLAVLRSQAGKGWSRRLLDWAAGEARRRGRTYLRLDTEVRPKLIALYESAGFLRVDQEPITVGTHRVVRFERAL